MTTQALKKQVVVAEPPSTKSLRERITQRLRQELTKIGCDGIVPTRDELRKTLKTTVEQLMNEEEARVHDLVKAALERRADVRNALVVRDYFVNATEGAVLEIFNTESPVECVEKVCNSLEEGAKFVQLGIVSDLMPDPKGKAVSQPVNQLCLAMEKQKANGVMVSLIGTIGTQPYSKLVPFLKKHSLLGSQPRRDSVQVFVGEVFQRAHDAEATTAHSPVGALMGKRQMLDVTVGVAEPMDGDRSTGSGAKGGLKDVQLVPLSDGTRFLEMERRVLSTIGINTLRVWSEVGDVVVVSNRSLLAGNSSSYIYASPGRLRNLIQAIFHNTAQRLLLGSGKRNNATLEQAMGVMNTFLLDLVKAGWIREGSRVRVDYAREGKPEEMGKLRLKVSLLPVAPIGRIEVEFWEDAA
jgi:hypothetical protein